jgi:anti-sigma regulatory factor (Ser/Thr protein kinase)
MAPHRSGLDNRPAGPGAGAHRGLTPIPANAGYHRPPHKANRGYGLWIARQLADVVTTHTDRDRTTITLDFPLAPRG